MRYRVAFLVLLAALSAGPALAWTTVGTGIEYEEFVLSDPNHVYVARMDRSNLQATLDTGLPAGKLSGAREVVADQAARLDDAINYWDRRWGQRNDVVIAVNGDWFYWTGLVYGGQAHSGWYSKPVYCEFGGNQFAWSLGRVPYIGGCTNASSSTFAVNFPATGQTLSAAGLNRARGADELVIYTPQFDSTTKTSAPGVEVAVEMASPTLILPSPDAVSGVVREIRQNEAGVYIPFDCIVLSATGTAATQLLANASVGAAVRLSQSVTSYEANCSTPSSYNWRDTYASIGGGHAVLQNGVVQDYSADPVMANRHPRTCVAYNSTYVFIIVCDGRSAASRGMTGIELGNFCKNTLGATWALNLDGGGSSTMVVNGSVMNVPSDGSPRAVGNTLMMINVLPKLNSYMFCSGQYVTNPSSTPVYLGPGTNYAVSATPAAGSVGNIAHHQLNGVYAKGTSWWKVSFAGVSGWVTQSSLSAHGTFAPTIVTQPSPAAGCIGWPAAFAIEARGSGSLSYQWYHNGVALASGQYYSGANTPTLTVLSMEPARAGEYHCVVTGTYGSATSNTATLTVNGITIDIDPPSVPATRTGSVSYRVTYTGASSIDLTPADVQLNKTGTANGSVSVMSGSGYRTVVISSITGNGTLGISIAPGTATGECPAPGAGPSATVIVDNTAPGTVTVTDEGTYTPSLNTLSAAWTPAGDGTGSGIAGYQYAVGTFWGGTNIKTWTSSGNVTSITDSSLALTEGTTYYLQVRAVDNVGLTGLSGKTDGITVAPGVSRIGLAWALNDSSPFSLRGKTVTAASPGAFWLEEADRSSAVKVLSTAPVQPGSAVAVAGVLGMAGPQRVMLADVVHSLGGGAQIAPVGLLSRDLGGSAVNPVTPGVTGAGSAYNVGLLVRCWGRVVSSDSTDPTNQSFRMDDGSSPAGAPQGLKALCGDTAPPPVGSYVAATGVVGLEASGQGAVAVLVVRSPTDVQPLAGE